MSGFDFDKAEFSEPLFCPTEGCGDDSWTEYRYQRVAEHTGGLVKVTAPDGSVRVAPAAPMTAEFQVVSARDPALVYGYLCGNCGALCDLETLLVYADGGTVSCSEDEAMREEAERVAENCWVSRRNDELERAARKRK